MRSLRRQGSKVKSSDIHRSNDSRSGSSHTPLHGYLSHLLGRPVFTHILGPQLVHLIIQMLPQHCTECVEDCLHLVHPQFFLSTATLGNVILEFVQTVVDLLVLCEEFQFLFEGRHLARKDREDVLLLNRVVDSQVVAEFVTRTEELSDGHALWAFVVFTGAIKHIPCSTEVLVLPKLLVNGCV